MHISERFRKQRRKNRRQKSEDKKIVVVVDAIRHCYSSFDQVSNTEMVMASLSLNSLPVQPPSQHCRKLIDAPSSTSLNYGTGAGGSLKPIVISGDPPTFVSAPGRRIVAG